MNKACKPGIIALEIPGIGKKAKENYKNGIFNYWTVSRIKMAFNFHAGTIDDLKKYAENNKKYCTVIFL